mmetsp:Transcript_88334/g.175630  ORF Transcript_88334/g.175630 Transcript_88334/m.175630 type:complete len:354 (+) Transcript_88334:49-1110(+)
MPLYEEKLISPLAIRFSQARVRPTFRDGRSIEAAIEQIQAQPCNIQASGGRYTLLLHAPFPPIEVISSPPRSSDGIEDKRLQEASHWITFDNRRLCCLQQAAATHWPHIAAAVVRVMYDMPVERSAVRKMGRSEAGTVVQVSRLHEPHPPMWDWRLVARTLGGDPGLVAWAVTAIGADSVAKRTDLADSPLEVKPYAPLAFASLAGQSLDKDSLFNLAAQLEKSEESGASHVSWPLKVTPLHQGHAVLTPPRPSSAVTRLFELAAKQERAFVGGTSASQELMSLLKAPASKSQSPFGEAVGRELLGRLNPAAAVCANPRIMVAWDNEESRNRVAEGIWLALGKDSLQRQPLPR